MPDPADTLPGEPELEQAGLLDGLEGDTRRERVDLLRYLAEQGATLNELAHHTADGTLLFLPAERLIGGTERYTPEDVARLAGVDLETLLRLRKAMGVSIPDPDARELTEADLEAAKLAREARDRGIAEDEILDVTRVLSRGLSQGAEVMRAITLRLVLEPGISERELAERYARAAAGLAPMTGPLVDNLLTLHLRQMATGEAIGAAERTGGHLPGSRDVAVSFADLVGFTRVGEEVPPDELGRMAKRLEELTAETVEPPVRMVKTIGDAAMLVSTDTERLLDSSLALVDAADSEGETFPQLRVGIAQGPALRRAGDWFGQPVNLASRITSVARPGSVLASRDVRDAARDGYRWSFAGDRRLKGIREPVPLFRARRDERD